VSRELRAKLITRKNEAPGALAWGSHLILKFYRLSYRAQRGIPIAHVHFTTECSVLNADC